MSAAVAQCQVALFYFAYLIGLSLARSGGFHSAWVEKNALLLSRVGLAHSVLFGLITLSPTLCQQHEYVLWGGVNIMLPLVRICNSFTSWSLLPCYPALATCDTDFVSACYD